MVLTPNPALLTLGQEYFFDEIERRIAEYKQKHPLSRVISLGIGDVTQPLTPVVAAALRTAVAEMASPEGVHGYPPVKGYDFLREAIVRQYAGLHCSVTAADITVTAGSKEGLAGIPALFAPEVPVWITDPVYPAYRQAAMAAGHPVRLMPCRAEDGFRPRPQDVTEPGLIVLCSPNNPTGAVLTAEDLQQWVDLALTTGSILLVDVAYSAYLSDAALPRSIYCIPGAERCAVEAGSFSKSDGFTGLRCGWMVIPEACGLQNLWERDLSRYSNGVSYPVQRAAEAALTSTGLYQRQKALGTYRRNAAVMTAFFAQKGLPYTGGENAPYLWVQFPDPKDSWGWFDRLLNECGVICTPGAGFGAAGEGWLRFTAFGEPAATAEALRRLEVLL